MTTPAFSQPAAGGQAGDNFTAAEHQNHLLLVFPKNFLPDQPTKKGISDTADCDIIIVDKFDPTGKPMSFINARLFGNLARSVRNDIGGQVLGRLKQITSANGNTPWVLEDFTPQDAAAATPILTAYQQGQFRQAQNLMQAPAPAVAAPAPTQYAAPPQQQWNAAPPAGPPQTAPATYTAPATAPPAAYTSPQAPPQQQWNAAAPTPPPAPEAAPDPAVIAALNAAGIFPPPGTPVEAIMQVYATLPPAANPNQPPF